MEKRPSNRIAGWINKQVAESKILFRCIPAYIIVIFVVSVISMNILANKTIVNLEWIAIDGGITISWLSFLCMDLVTKHFGPHAGNKMTIFAVFVNLFVCLIFYLVSIIPTREDYSAFNSIIGGTWFILLSSTIAFIASGFLNNGLNFAVGKIFNNNPNGKLAFFIRSYVSTFIGQFVDNFIFAALTFMVFAPIFWDGFSWSIVQVLVCSLTGALLELLAEALFSPFAYRISKRWLSDGIGEEYFFYLKEHNDENTNHGN